ncbi:hypothetical protein [[Eubacterium] cellulosolvens]
MSEKKDQHDTLDLVTFGFFLVLAGIIFLITPNLLENIYAFLRDLDFKEAITYVYLPAPQGTHTILFTAISRFTFYFALVHLFILAARYFFRSPKDKIAGTVSGLVFWFGATWILNKYIEADIVWFRFLGYLIALVGISVVIKNIITLSTVDRAR